MICPHCGCQVQPNARFCAKCGTPIEQQGTGAVQAPAASGYGAQTSDYGAASGGYNAQAGAYGGYGADQGNYGGAQGGYGTDPYGYGADPYAAGQTGSFGADPYAMGQAGGYGADPYGMQGGYGTDPYATGQAGGYGAQTSGYGYDQGAGQASEPAKKKRNLMPVIIAVVGLLVVGGIVGAGILTNWFGFGQKRGIWVLTKTYLDDEVYEEYDYDDNGRLTEQRSYWDGDKSKVSYKAVYDYESSDGSVFTIKYTYYDEDGSENGTGEERYEFELDEDGRVVSTSNWWSSDGPLEDDDLTDALAFKCTCSYDSDGCITERVNIDPEEGSGYYTYASITYDVHGFQTSARANSKSDASDRRYVLKYDDKDHIESVEANGKKFTCDTDEDGNIIAIYDEDGEAVCRYEYTYVAKPTAWFAQHPSVYVGSEDW